MRIACPFASFTIAFANDFALPFLFAYLFANVAQSGGVEDCKNKKTVRACASDCFSKFYGWKMGFEPTTFGTTIRHSNRLSYIHHIDLEFQIGVQI